jgi:parallel beta-helix repeat protein
MNFDLFIRKHRVFVVSFGVVAVFLTLFSLSFTRVLAAGNSYYVAKTGNDTNDGSIAHPFLTVQKAVNSVAAGDTIYLRTGTYSESVRIATTGASGNIITLTHYTGESATIDGGSDLALYTANTSIAYWTVDGLTIKGSGQFTTRWGWWGEAAVDHIIVRNCTIYGANFIVGSYHLWDNNDIDGTGYSVGTDGYGGINDANGSSYNTFSNNTIHDFTNVNGRGIYTQGKTHDDLIENNTIYNITEGSGLSQCIDIDGRGDVVWRHTVIGNTVYNCGYVGIQLENAFATVVENNKVNADGAGITAVNYTVDGWGCTVGGESNQFGDTNGDGSCAGENTQDNIVQNVIWSGSRWAYGGLMNWDAGGLNIWGNTIYAISGGGNGGINFQGGDASTTAGATIKSNIISNGSGVAVCALGYSSFSVDNNNLLYVSDGSHAYATGTGCNNYSSLANYQTTTGKGQNSLFGVPMFNNLGARDFSLTATSPAIDHGVSVGTTTDFANKPRPFGISYDIGAYEYQSLLPTPTPTALPTATPVPTAVPTISPYVSDGTGACVINGQTFQFQTTLDLSGIPNPQFAFVRMFYNVDTAQPIGFDSTDSHLFPTQGMLVDSSGSSGQSSRKVEVFQGWPEIPNPFQFALYSSTGLTK